MEQIDPELLKRLDAIAAKMGVGAGEAWRIFIHQAYIEAWSWVPFILAWVMCCGVALYGASAFRKAGAKRMADGYSDCNDYTCSAWACRGVAVIFFVAVMSCVSSMMMLALNPEAYALRELLFRLK